MKKLLYLLSLFCCTAAWGQIDIPINQIGPNTDITRGATWAGSGQGAINNNFVVLGAGSQTGVCIGVRNNDTNPHNIVVQVFITTDQNTKTFTGNTGRWSLVPTQGQAALAIPATSAVNLYVSTQGSTAYTISITGGSGTGTGDVYVSQTAQPCGAQNNPVNCNQNFSLSIGTGATGTLVAGLTGRTVYLCNATIGFTAAPAAAAVGLGIGYGAVGCGSSTNQWQIPTVATMPTTFFLGGGGTFVVPGTGGAMGQSLCVSTGAITTTVQINGTYAQF